jgi:hypothetical protein
MYFFSQKIGYYRVLLDSISKYNLYSIEKIFFLSKFQAFVLLKTIDSAFLSSFLNLSKIFLFWFNMKVQILKVKKIKNLGKSKIRNSLIFYAGISFSNKKKIFKNLNYLKNIVNPVSMNVDNGFLCNTYANSIKFSFSNVNYLLGLPVERFYS